MNEEKTPAVTDTAEKKKKTTVKKFAACVLYVLLAAVLILLFFSVVANKSSGKPSFIFNHSILRVETGSMESTIPAKSYILVKKADAEDLKEGDVITFVSKDETLPVYGELVTHRIEKITEDGAFITRGDANAAADRVPVQKEDIVAVYVTNLKLLTLIGRTFSSRFGLILIVGVFLVSFCFIYLPDFLTALKEKDGETENESVSDEEKQKQIDARVAEEVQRLEEEAKNRPKENPAENNANTCPESGRKKNGRTDG